MINDSLIQQPKAELHIHLEGSLEPEMMLRLANKNGIKLTYKTLNEIVASYNFNNLQEFLDLYYQGMSVLQTESDFFDLTYAYLSKAKEDHVTHTEMFIDPQAHLERSIDLSILFNGISRAIKQAEIELDIKGKVIVCFLRHLPEDNALKVFDQLMDFRHHFIGIGLDSTEVGNPPRKFKRLFDLARNEGLHLVAHAGEEGPVDYIWEAIDILGVERVDHGNVSLEDETLIKRLANDGIPLTMCPLSNQCLQVVPELSHHPAKQLLDKDVKVTLNSDDPAYFGGYINQNYRILVQKLALQSQDINQLIKNSLLSKFC